jgi:hypothetical protein
MKIILSWKYLPIFWNIRCLYQQTTPIEVRPNLQEVMCAKRNEVKGSESESVLVEENGVYGLQFRLAAGKSAQSDSENCKAAKVW